VAQVAIHNSLTVYEELVSLMEKQEADVIAKEVEKRRMRLNASGPEQLRKEVGKDVWGDSKVSPLPTLNRA
jgi:superkiller protein 3